MLFAKRWIEYVYDFHYQRSLRAASSVVNDVPLIMVVSWVYIFSSTFVNPT